MKIIQFTSTIQLPILFAPIRKRTMQDVDFTPRETVKRKRAKTSAFATSGSAPRLFNCFK